MLYGELVYNEFNIFHIEMQHSLQEYKSCGTKL